MKSVDPHEAHTQMGESRGTGITLVDSLFDILYHQFTSDDCPNLATLAEYRLHLRMTVVQALKWPVAPHTDDRNLVVAGELVHELEQAHFFGCAGFDVALGRSAYVHVSIGGPNRVSHWDIRLPPLRRVPRPP